MSQPVIHDYGPSFQMKRITEATDMWKNDTGKRIYANLEGKVVEENDPTAAYLVVAADSSIPIDTARRYGLVKDEAEEAEAEQPAAKADTPAPDPGAKALRAGKGK